MAALIALLEAGTTPWRREWDGASGGHHLNLLSGRRYRGANPVLLTLGLHLRGSAIPYWCGFQEAKALGILPRKGSKAVHVLRPQVHQRGEGRLVDASSTDGANPGGSWVSYRSVAVFNVVDLEGEGAVLRPEPERLVRAEAVLSSGPVEVLFGGDRACYLPSLDRIQLPDRSTFHSAGALYATWAHEAIHSSGHSSRLARDLSGGKAYAREELVAELLKESPKVLFRVLSDARKAADLISPEAPEAHALSWSYCSGSVATKSTGQAKNHQ
ncbi:DUF1738 domain-containing protein [Cyanobium sp. HWJ4-Hawea]|nr:DUF1738 domain-containing protein [Cyanobium sp. HWJ4-Hawea]